MTAATLRSFQEDLQAARTPLAPVPDESRRFRLLTLDDLAKVPPPGQLIDDLVLAESLSVIYGPSGVGKSFLAFDWGRSIASGRDWYGRATTKGPVLYIAAEGIGGYVNRAIAWASARNVIAHDGFHLIGEAVNLLERSQVDALLDTIRAGEAAPALVVFDTLARCIVGGDENSARDVGLAIDGADRIKRELGCTVLLIHHTGKDGELERGSSALRAAADLMWSLKPDGSSMRLECEKAKDIAPPAAWTLHLEPTADSAAIALGTNEGALSAGELKLLRTVPDAFGTDPAPSGKLQRASGIPERSFYREVHSLVGRECCHC